MQHGRLRTIRCLWSVDKLFKLLFTNISDIFIAGTPIPKQHPALRDLPEWSVRVQGESCG